MDRKKKERRVNKRVKEARILHVGLPLKKRFKHALTLRTQSDSIFLKILLEDGTFGYGESLPREYVTGETAKTTAENLKGIIRKNILGYAPKDYKGIISFIKDLDIKGGAARCALELALLDAYGRHFNDSVSSIIGEEIRDSVVYSGVIQASSTLDAIRLSLAFKIYGLNFVKVKVGMGDDLARLSAIRKILGNSADIRVDANCAWTPDKAIEKIEKMRAYGISAVEQPVSADDYQGLKKVTDSVPEAIIADESLRTIEDAQELAKKGACNMFNIRISKCGGLLDSLRIADIAKRHNVGIQLGCQVGESGLLSAAGRHFAGLFDDIAFCEGSYGRFLLKEDVSKEDITIRRGGRINSLKGPGLGVNIMDNILNKYTLSTYLLE